MHQLKHVDGYAVGSLIPWDCQQATVTLAHTSMGHACVSWVLYNL